MNFSLRMAASMAALSLVAAVATQAPAQASPQPAPGSGQKIAIRSVRAIPENGGAAVEIISTRPLVPAISQLENPTRLVIDLANAWLAGSQKTVAFRSDQINGIRMNQFQESPPVARIVVDLAKPIAYTWDAAGNRLMVRLHAEELHTGMSVFPSRESSPGAVALRSGVRGGVVLAGNRVAPGSSVTAGLDAAVLNLARGGEVRVCPGTTVAVTASQNGQSLMLSMNSGALEAHYALGASSDSILTPDFRILLAGPGEFHYGVTADARGNTCIQALPGNTASVIVAELLGDGTYQVKPTQQVMFRGGHLAAMDSAVPASCGCPPATPAIIRASTTSTVSQPGAPATSPSQFPFPGPETAPLPPSKANDIHVQVDVPFVFNARDLSPPRPAPTAEARLLPLRDLPASAYLQTTALPPPRIRSERRGFFGKIKGFFAGIFG